MSMSGDMPQAPKDFSQDGAFGGASSGGSFGSGSTPADNTQDWGSTSFGGAGAGALYGAGSNDIGFGQNYAADGSIGGLGAGKSTTDPTGYNGNPWVVTNKGGSASPMFMAEGGAIDDGSGGDASGDASDPMASSIQQSINSALGTVDSVLSYGRQLHGLGSGDDEGSGAIDTASNMPTIPGTQSESGVKPLQPMPGKLPPTDNPFGKRADNMPANPGDQSTGQWGVPVQRPAQGTLQPIKQPPGTWKPPRRADVGDGAIPTDDEGTG